MNSDVEFAAWQMYMRAGNDCFEKRQTLTAISHYNEAQYQARCLIDLSENKSGAIAALIASHHNLAEVYRNEAELELCEQALCDALKAVDQVLECCATDSATYVAALHGKSTAYSALVHFRKIRSQGSPIPSQQPQWSHENKHKLN